MASEQKVYDYNRGHVESKIVTALRKRDRESTVADIIAQTGLPKLQVEETLKSVVYDYAGQMKVTESGELLYYFPEGFRNRNTGALARLKRGLAKAVSVLGKIGTFLFKVWIMVMLVGYFVIFVALLILAMLASMAGSGNRDSDRRGGRGGGIGGIFFTTRIIQFFIYLWLYSGAPSKDQRGLDFRRRKQKGRPLHQSVFAFVFGDKTEVDEWEERETRGFISYVQSHKGVISIEELMQLTGRSRRKAQALLNLYLVRYEGEPGVTDDGALIFSFPELLRTKDVPAEASSFGRELMPLIPFNKNKGNMNKWIGFLNGFNLVFGGYFFAYGFLVQQLSQASPLDRFYAIVIQLLSRISGDPVTLAAIGLGVVPLAFSFFFYTIPLVRRIIERRRNERIKEDNLRKMVLSDVLIDPEHINPADLEPDRDDAKPADWKQMVEAIIQDAAGERPVNVKETQAEAQGRPAAYEFSVPELKHDLVEVERHRNAIRITDYEPGRTVFDSGADSE